MSNEQNNEKTEPREWTICDDRLESVGSQVTGIHMLPNGRAVLEYRTAQDVSVGAWTLVDPQWIRNFVVDQDGNMWDGEPVGSGGTLSELLARAATLTMIRPDLVAADHSRDYLNGMLAQPSTFAAETFEDLIRNAFEAGFDAAMSAKGGRE